MKDKTWFKVYHWESKKERPIVGVSLGVHFANASLPHPDMTDTHTTLAGVCKRIACRPPRADPDLIRELTIFADNHMRKNYKPLQGDTDLSVLKWLASTNYPEWRKKQLLKTHEENKCKQHFQFDSCADCKRIARCKCFVKDESYPSYKHARGIYSRSDQFKCMIGPWMKAIESEIYKDKMFIKHVPVNMRPHVIYEALYEPGAKYISTDYTSFESLFTRQLMEALEMQLYRYMTQYLPNKSEFDALLGVLVGTNVCRFKDFDLYVEASRMSGEMCTSLGNGYANMIIIKFITHKQQIKMAGFVEGDDGLSRVSEYPDESMFERLGLNVKLERHTDLHRASFCGIIFDLEDKINITNPIDAMLEFGWAYSRYARSSDRMHDTLLYCKALSMLYQYPGCPVLQSLALMIIRLVPHPSIYKIIKIANRMNSWDRDQLFQAINNRHRLVAKPVGLRTRCLMESEFHVSIDEQIRLEKHFDGATRIAPIPYELAPVRMQDDAVHYDLRYTMWGDKSKLPTFVTDLANKNLIREFEEYIAPYVQH